MITDYHLGCHFLKKLQHCKLKHLEESLTMNYSSFVPCSSMTTMLELLMTRNCKILIQGSFKWLYVHNDFKEN